MVDVFVSHGHMKPGDCIALSYVLMHRLQAQSYTPDACMSAFSPEQLTRIGSGFDAFRSRYQLTPLPLPANPVLRLPPSPPPPAPKKTPTAAATATRSAPITAKPVAPVVTKPATVSARTATKKPVNPPTKKVGG